MTQAHRQSSGSTKLLVPEHAVPSILLLPPTFTQSTAVHFTLSANQRLYSFYSPNIYCISGDSPWLTSLPIPHPPKKGRENLQLPPSNQPPGNFISPTFASCGKSSLQFDLPHHQSGFLASFLSCPIPPKIIAKETEPQPQPQQVCFKR
ncbi:serine/arginine-rich splicing factor 3a isoform X2 [Pundamilia nyererei]|uniref:Serine/arginine-rich splicing factor 3a isoform X2 n=1 Tax=Pundamilia nyererei TaxID=303518 RepID=A0A9Y6J670_9CICH|nr:uncharacterized protein LOC101484575 isoform X2 [Maylandia zebra]XP_013764033.1 PREDICTED: uncharacterized protein LOC102198387 isoform X2 [Pundamilia nyererei]XP_026023230.1 uncharacterized protein LOC113022251 isoform X2 [Astatotilapia calliptera]